MKEVLVRWDQIANGKCHEPSQNHEQHHAGVRVDKGAEEVSNDQQLELLMCHQGQE